MVKNLPSNAGDAGDSGSIPNSGRSPGVGNGNPFGPTQYSCLENSADKNFWWATVHGVAKSWTRLTPHPHYYLNVGVPQSSDPNPFLTLLTPVASLVSKLDLSSECETYI